MAKPSPVIMEEQDLHLQVPLERHYRFSPAAGVGGCCLLIDPSSEIQAQVHPLVLLAANRVAAWNWSGV